MDLSVERIEEAARVIDPVFRGSPQFVHDQLSEALGRRVLVKVETLNPLRSFKGRGAQFLVDRLDAGLTVVCSSTGNFGQAIAYAARARGMAAHVFVPEDVNPAKLDRMRSLGAVVRIIGVCAAGAPAMAESWRTGTPVATASVDTIADGIAVRDPIPASVQRTRQLVDDIVLVDDTALLEAMGLTLATLGVVPEPAGAAGIAAIRGHDLPGDRLATVITGGNIRPDLLAGLCAAPAPAAPTRRGT